MSDTNVHRLVGNLLVGTSHFFVDTTTNQIGVNTSTPSAALDVASGDLKVGSDITLASGGTITATAFDGDGSLLSNINSDSGSWVNGNNSNVHLATSTDKVGIGVENPGTALEIFSTTGTQLTIRSDSRYSTIFAIDDAGSSFFGNDRGDIRFTTGGDATNGTGASEKMRILGNGNVGIGTSSPSHMLHIETPTGTASNYVRIGSYMNDGSSQSISGIEFATNPEFSNGDNVQRVPGQIRSGFLNGTANWGDAYISLLTTVGATGGLLVDALTVRGGNVGVGTSSPGASLDVAAQHGNIASPMVHFRANRDGATNGDGNVLLLENSGNRSDVELLECKSSGNTRFVVKANGDVTVPGPLYLYGQGNPLSTLDGYWNYENKVALVMQPPADNGSIGILFMSKGNETSDLAYIMYDEDYGEAGVSAGENGALVLGCENDGTGSSDHVRIKSRLVVEADMSSSDPTYAFQVKSSNTTSDLFAVHRGGAIGYNGVDTNVPFTIQSNKTISVDGTWTSYCRWYRGSGNWFIGSDNNTSWNHNLYWFANTNESGNPLRKVITFENDQSKSTVVNQNTFTGQHRNIVKDVNPANIESFIGLIVSADNNENIKVNGGVERGLEAITINETIPLVSVTTRAYDKQVFGVISGSEDPDSRQDTYGRVTCSFIKEEGDDRIFINSLGEGAMWISNQNGPLTSGDYVTSSHIPGYGMKQDSEFLANYTVAKITMDCDFQATTRIKYKIKSELRTVNYYRFDTDLLSEKKYNLLNDETKQKYTLEQYDENVNILDEHGQLQWEDSGETEAPYKVRFLLPDGTQISEEEYTTRALADEKVYVAAFVGCTYHCG
jgi:hypothetical protein